MSYTCRRKGVFAHQDLKPANIFFDDLKKHNVPLDSPGMHQHFFVADFGLANAFREIGTNNGSRPYMPPEQHDDSPFDPSKEPKFDIFALGVIAHEIFTDGRHPIGCITSDVWPWQKGIPQKWNRKSTWKDWSKIENKSTYIPESSYSAELSRLINKMMMPSPSDRPSLIEFEKALSGILKEIDAATAQGFGMQVDSFEGMYMSDLGWPHMDQKLLELREFYSRL